MAKIRAGKPFSEARYMSAYPTVAIIRFGLRTSLVFSKDRPLDCHPAIDRNSAGSFRDIAGRSPGPAYHSRAAQSCARYRILRPLQCVETTYVTIDWLRILMLVAMSNPHRPGRGGAAVGQPSSMVPRDAKQATRFWGPHLFLRLH